MRPCPFCAEQIQDDAIVCRFCQRDLKKESKIETVVEDKSANNLTNKKVPVLVWFFISFHAFYFSVVVINKFLHIIDDFGIKDLIFDLFILLAVPLTFLTLKRWSWFLMLIYLCFFIYAQVLSVFESHGIVLKISVVILTIALFEVFCLFTQKVRSLYGISTSWFK